MILSLINNMKANKKILITGGAGFIGHHFISFILRNTDWDIVSLDRLDFSGSLERLREVILPGDESRIKIVFHDLKAPISEFNAKMIGSDIDYIVHFAASSHVDRSIEDPLSFIMDNVVGTTNLLNFARTLPTLEKFINFSTDESMGAAAPGEFHKEWSPHKPSNPYAASKAGQEDIGYAFFVTYGLPVITTHTMNNFGERQHPEKLIPKAIRCTLNKEKMPIFSEIVDGQLKSVGSRVWIYTEDTCDAIKFILEKGVPGEKYNVIGFDEKTNEDVVKEVSNVIMSNLKDDEVGRKIEIEYIDFHKSRPGHDRRYALDGSKLRELGWTPKYSFEEAIKKVVEFSLRNPKWQ